MEKPKIIVHLYNGLVENIMADQEVQIVVLDADSEIFESDPDECVFSMDTYGEQAFRITQPDVDVTKRTKAIFDEAMDKIRN